MIKLQPADAPGLDLATIQIDGGTQSRANVNQAVVTDYAEAIKAGADFPAIVVFYDGKKHWLADGFHRFHAYQKLGREKVAADVRQGTRRDAILHSVGANETHGLRRTRDDKRRAILTLLNDKEWSKWSDREIARQCAVSPDTVGRIRKEIAPVTVQSDSEDRSYTTKHGTVATMKTAGINAGRAKSATHAQNAQVEVTTSEPKEIKAFEPDKAGEVTASEDARTEAEREADAIQSPFDRASEAGRALFLTRNNLGSPEDLEARAEIDRLERAISDAGGIGNALSAILGTEVEIVAVQESERPHAAVANPPTESAAGEISAEIQESPSNRDVSADGEASPLVGPQAEASPSREQEAGTLAGHEGRSDGEPASVGLPTNSGPRKHPLRPHCQHPYEEICGGYGTKHCQPCLKAAQAEEVA